LELGKVNGLAGNQVYFRLFRFVFAFGNCFTAAAKSFSSHRAIRRSSTSSTGD